MGSETAARASVAQLASQKENQIRELFCHRKCFLILYQAVVAKQKYINVLVGTLKTLADTYLIECLPFESYSSVNSGFFCTLWMT